MGGFGRTQTGQFRADRKRGQDIGKYNIRRKQQGGQIN